MPRYSNTENTDITVKYCYEELKKIKPDFEKKQLAELINSTKQNIGQRIKRDSKLSNNERNILKEKLEELNVPTKFLNPSIVSDNMVQVPFRSEVELSCGTGTVSNADFVSDSIGLDINFIKEFGGNPHTVSVVFARGDSMADRIESGDALIIDESKTYITNGKVYAFVYDSELYCKQLIRKGNTITAISYNKEYEPFEIEQEKQFTIVGQIISTIKRI